jgi:hypothetical protein
MLLLYACRMNPHWANATTLLAPSRPVLISDRYIWDPGRVANYWRGG